VSKRKRPVSNIQGTEYKPKIRQQYKARKIIIICSAILLVSVVTLVIFGIYNSEIKPLKKTALEINDTALDMEYYVDMLDAYTKNIQPNSISYMADLVIQQIVRNELIRQGAINLNIAVTSEEIELALIQTEHGGDKIYEDIAESELLNNRIIQLFSDKLPDEMEQIHANVMLVESEEVAIDAIARIENGEEFKYLIDEYSCGIEKDGDLGWLPEELITNSIVAEEVSNLKPGAVSTVYDELAKKNIAYWLIEVTDTDDTKGKKIRAILLSNRAEAEMIKKRLETEDFEVLAEENSLYVSSEKGGELGWLKPGDMENDTFDSVAFELSTGVVSDPIPDESIETEGGYWVIQLLAREVHELNTEAKTGISQKDFIEWLSELEQSSTIAIHLDGEMKSWAAEKVMKRRK
jgi:peptidyl-prolyl cis-trans isomerase C